MFDLKHGLETARRLQEQKFQHGCYIPIKKLCHLELSPGIEILYFTSKWFMNLEDWRYKN